MALVRQKVDSAISDIGVHVGGRAIVTDAEALRICRATGASDVWVSEMHSLGLWVLDPERDVQAFAAGLLEAVRPLAMLGELGPRGGALQVAFVFCNPNQRCVEAAGAVLAALRAQSAHRLPPASFVTVGPHPPAERLAERLYDQAQFHHIPLTCVPFVDGSCFHLDTPEAMPFDSRHLHDADLSDMSQHHLIPMPRLEAYCDAASRLASLCHHSLGLDLRSVWCIGDSSRAFGRLAATEAAAMKKDTPKQGQRGAGLLLVDRTLDLRSPLNAGDALVNAALSAAAPGSGVTYDGARALLSDMQTLKGKAIERLAAVAAHDAKVEHLLRRGISSTERLFALYSRIASSDKCSLIAQQRDRDSGERQISAIIQCLADAGTPLPDADAPPPPSMEAALRTALKAMKDALRGTPAPSPGAQQADLRAAISLSLGAAAHRPPLEACAEAIRALLVAFSVHACGVPAGGVAGSLAEPYAPSPEEDMLLAEYEAILARLLAKAVEEEGGCGGGGSRLAGALGKEVAGLAEMGSAARAARAVLEGAEGLVDVRQRSGVLTGSLLDLASHQSPFVSVAGLRGVRDTGLLLTDAHKISVEVEQAAQALQQPSVGWLGSIGSALLGEAPDEDIHTIVVCVVGGIAPVEAMDVISAVRGGGSVDVIVGGTSSASPCDVFDGLFGQSAR